MAEDVPVNLHELDINKLGGEVTNVSIILKRPGASSDLLKGELFFYKDNTCVQVGIKRIRCSMQYNKQFEKASNE